MGRIPSRPTQDVSTSVPSGKASRIQVLSILAGAGAMWLLHRSGHGAFVVTLVGVGVYAAINVAVWTVARRRSAFLEERRRRNFQIDMEERHRHFDGHGK